MERTICYDINEWIIENISLTYDEKLERYKKTKFDSNEHRLIVWYIVKVLKESTDKVDEIDTYTTEVLSYLRGLDNSQLEELYSKAYRMYDYHWDKIPICDKVSFSDGTSTSWTLV